MFIILICWLEIFHEQFQAKNNWKLHLFSKKIFTIFKAIFSNVISNFLVKVLFAWLWMRDFVRKFSSNHLICKFVLTVSWLQHSLLHYYLCSSGENSHLTTSFLKCWWAFPRVSLYSEERVLYENWAVLMKC